MKKETYSKIQKEIKGLKQSNLLSSWWLLRAILLSALWVTLLSSNNTFLIILGVLLGTAVVFNWISILHDCGHGHFFSSPFLNTSVGLIASCFSLLPFEQWRVTHNLHHRWTGYFDKDPTTSGPNERIMKDNQKKIVDIAWKYWIPIFVISYYVRSFWNPSFTLQFSKTKRKKFFQIFCLFFMFLPYVLLLDAFGWKFLSVFLLSTFVTLFVSDPFLLSQHNYFERGYTQEFSKPVPPREQDSFTRELMFPSFISNLVFMNFNYHVAHHYFPHLPAYYLPRLHYETPNRISWLRWVLRAKKIPGHKILMGFGNL
ncbi:MAG: fatty acid desaturase [Bdellovibrionota bacterium]|nr:fatty acid desaturase [Bdellovibrionota bacterium]